MSTPLKLSEYFMSEYFQPLCTFCKFAQVKPLTGQIKNLSTPIDISGHRGLKRALGKRLKGYLVISTIVTTIVVYHGA